MDSTTAAAHVPAKKPGVLINRDFGLLFFGGSISYIGDFIYTTTLVLWIATTIGKGQTWAPLAVSGVLLAQALPELLVGVAAGVFVDRWDKRHTMLLMDVLRAVLVAALVLATNLVPLPFLPDGRLSAVQQLVAVYAIVALAGACSQFFNPARMALIGDIVAEEYRARASGLMQMVIGLAIVVGPALAGPLFFVFGVQWALLLNAASFLVSFGTLLFVRAPRKATRAATDERPSFVGELFSGLRFYAGNRVLVTLLVTGIIIMFAAGALNALDVFFALQNLHAPASVYGFLTAATGAGILIGSIVFAVTATRIGVARLVWLTILGMGVVLLVYSRMTLVAPAIALVFVVGVGNAGLNVGIEPLILHVTPRELVGRVHAVIQPSLALMSMLSMAMSGYLVSTILQGFHATPLGMRFGAVDTLYSVASVVVIIGGLFAMIALRGVHLAGERGGPPSAAGHDATREPDAAAGITLEPLTAR